MKHLWAPWRIKFIQRTEREEGCIFCNALKKTDGMENLVIHRGERIFVSEDVNKGWNGFIKGAPVKQDVYIWRVTATFTNGRPFVEAGDVTVLVIQPK
jgi:hypothetical protein